MIFLFHKTPPKTPFLTFFSIYLYEIFNFFIFVKILVKRHHKILKSFKYKSFKINKLKNI